MNQPSVIGMHLNRRLRVGDLVRWRTDHFFGVVYAVAWSAGLGRVALAIDSAERQAMLPSRTSVYAVTLVGHDLLMAKMANTLLSSDLLARPDFLDNPDVLASYEQATRRGDLIGRLRAARKSHELAVESAMNFTHKVPAACAHGLHINPA